MTRGTHGERLAAYLSAHNAACPGCGYELRLISRPICPECGREIILAELLAPRPPTPKNDLLVLTITGLCGLIVLTLLGGLPGAAVLLSGTGAMGALLVLGALVGEIWLLVLCVRRPSRFVMLPRTVQWMFALGLGAPTLIGILAATALFCTGLVWTF